VYERGFREHLQRWAEAGRTVLVIRGIPVPVSNIPDCLAHNPHDYSACSGTRAIHLLSDPLARAAQANLSDRMRVADLTDFFCDKKYCRSVIGRAIVYFDASHMTATYARSLAPYLEEHVVRALRADAAARASG
jgi:hypothetical protein